MAFSAFAKPMASFAVAVFSLLLCASAPARDFVPMEDVTKLEKPTICIRSGNTLKLIDWDGQNERVWMTGEFNLPARFSRDGKRVAFIASTEDFGWYTLFILELETGRLINMTERLNNKGYEHIYIPHAVWFPDGRRLACDANDRANPAGFSEIYVLDFRAATLEQLTETPTQREYWPSVSRDGKKIVYFSTPSEKERAALGILPGAFVPYDLYTMNADESNVVNLTFSAADEGYPEWSPDGKKIAFNAFDRKEQEGEIRGTDLFMMDPDGSNVERLTSRKDGLRSLVNDWSADSKWILFHMELDDNLLSGLYRIHIETREMVRIGRFGAATWVHAGKSRFLSVDPADKKKAQWGALKEADSSPNNPTSQDGE
ncbi:MAG: hypothetical protein OXT69_13690 [Candidatus Poribacteria bacterium]|nr:hypothetical protein [Candidatus Poribacteria bacterium]